MQHLDFLARMPQNRGLGRTLTTNEHWIMQIYF